MRLRRIRLTNFKRFADFEAQFSPGINVVKGPRNEMGKSTLLEGIIVALFRDPKSAAREVKAYASWGSMDQFRTSLEFEHDGNGYLLDKDFDRGTVKLTGIDSGEEIHTFKEVAERMDELVGTKSDKLFVCSCCIRQSQVAEISEGEKEIGESLEEVVTGGRESTLASKVIQKLESKISDMRKGLDKPARNPGTIATLRNRLQDASLRYEQVREEVSRVEAQKLELVEVTGQLGQVKDEHEKCRALLEKNLKRQEIEAEIERLSKEYERVQGVLDRIRKHEDDLKKAEEALAATGFEDKQQVVELRRKLDDARRQREDIGRDMAEREAELAAARERQSRSGLIGFVGSGKGIAAAAAILAGGMVGGLLGPVYLIGLTVVGAVLLVVSLRARISLIRDRAGISGIEERVRSMKESLGKLGREEQELLAKSGCSTGAEFDEKEKSFRHWLEKKGEARYRLDEALVGRTAEDIEKRRLGLARDLAVEEQKLTDDMKQTRVSPEQFMELEERVRSLEASRAELEDRRRKVMATIDAANHDAEEQTRLEEEIEGLREALGRQEKKAMIYELAGDIISRARLDVLSSADEALQGEIQRCFSLFTNGKYQRVSVNKEDLEFWVYSDEKGDWATPSELSGGVIDEFSLAFRLALARLIFSDKKPPLILDDPFVNFDPERLTSTLDFFRTLAEEYQIVIFTLSDDYDAVADNIVLLNREERLL